MYKSAHNNQFTPAPWSNSTKSWWWYSRSGII